MIRPAVLVALVAAASPAAAQDRYGPSSETLRGTASVAYRGPLLTWAGKDAQLRGREAAAPTTTRAAPQPVSYRQPTFGALPQLPAPAAGPAPSPVPQVAQTPTPYARPTPATAQTAADPARVARGYGQAAGAASVQPGSFAPQTPRRYSLVREFGQEPDPIPLPKASVLAFSPEVGAAFAAQNSRDDGLLSPADQDMLQQAADDDASREDRQKARDKAQAAAVAARN